MLKHLIALIWNKKRQNFLLITEILISFMVIFVVFTLIVANYNNYKRSTGFDEENIWAIKFTDKATPAATDTTVTAGSNEDHNASFREILRQNLRSLPGVKAVSFTTNNIPFSFVNNRYDIEYGNVKANTNVYDVEDDYPAVLGIKMKEGRWFSKLDDGARNKPVVINETLRKKLFGKEDAIGKIINQEKVVGVIDDLKDKSDFQSHEGAIFKRADTSELRWLNDVLIRVDPDAKSSIEVNLYKTLASSMRNSNVEIGHLSEKKAAKNNITLVPMMIVLTVAGFLIINVALGLFGVLWYNINQRRGEIGLRRAVGASGKAVSAQLIAESVVLSSISIILGSLFAIQFPLLGVFDVPALTYILAILLDIAFVYLLVVICAFYPGRQAAAIYPAIALYEE